MSVREDMKEMIDNLKRERDELRVQLNLLQKEAREEWDELDDTWHKLRVKVNDVAEESGEVGSDVYAAIKLLGNEVKTGLKRIKRTL